MPSSIAFTIKGNHKDKTGNAVPKLKMTGKQSWTPKAREYVQWKDYVRARLVFDTDGRSIKAYLRNMALGMKPIVLEEGQHAFMILRIDWRDGHHGDPENIFGSIADALFENDKKLDCMTLSRVSADKQGEVRAVIWIFDDEKSKVDFISSMIK